MDYTYKNWEKNDYYNFSVEFNRIESYNELCKKWLQSIGSNIDFTSKTNWAINDIVDINDYNRVKKNINLIIDELYLDINNLNISSAYNQTFDYNKANELELTLKEYLKAIGEMQFSCQISGNAVCGNSTRIVG